MTEMEQFPLFTYVELETASMCNRRCKLCIRQSHPDQEAMQPWHEHNLMPMETIHAVFAELGGFAEVSMYPAVCWMLPRLTVNLVGYFDERFVPTMWEDNDYAKRVLNEGGKFIVVTDCQVEHRRSKENNANFEGRIGSIYAENQRRFNEKWGL